MARRLISYEPEANKENNRIINGYGPIGQRIIDSIYEELSLFPEIGEKLIGERHLFKNEIDEEGYHVNYRIFYIFNRTNILIFRSKFDFKLITS
jgi:hypothetical protein